MYYYIHRNILLMAMAWPAFEAVGVVAGIVKFSLRDLMPKAPLDNKTVTKLEVIDFLRAKVLRGLMMSKWTTMKRRDFGWFVMLRSKLIRLRTT